LALIALTIALVSAQSRVCFPGEYTTDQISHDPAQDDTLLTRHFFSESQKKARIDLHLEDHDGHIQRQRASYIFDWPAKKWYEIHYTGTGPSALNCTVHALDGPFERPCLSRTAHQRGQVTIAGTLLANNYVEFVNENSFRVAVDILVAANVEIPIRAVERRDENGNISIHSQEWVNWRDQVNHDHFRVPSVCQKNATTLVMLQKQAQTLAQVADTIFAEYPAAAKYYKK